MNWKDLAQTHCPHPGTEERMGLAGLKVTSPLMLFKRIGGRVYTYIVSHTFENIWKGKQTWST